MNEARKYAAQVAALMARVKQGVLWEKFLAAGESFAPPTDWSDSAAVAKKYHTRKKACFDNCRSIALRRTGLTYYEGYVCTVVPIAHAWLVTAQGTVIDPTLCLINHVKYPPTDYFGLRIPREALLLPGDLITPLWAQVLA
jgi:hypothetical protein